jgi:hypothetical protein
MIPRPAEEGHREEQKSLMQVSQRQVYILGERLAGAGSADCTSTMGIHCLALHSLQWETKVAGGGGVHGWNNCNIRATKKRLHNSQVMADKIRRDRERSG